MKSFLPRINYKMVTNRLREMFEEVDIKKRGALGFDDFVTLYQKLMNDNNVSISLCVHWNFIRSNKMNNLVISPIRISPIGRN